jgi:DNA repair protein RadC
MKANTENQATYSTNSAKGSSDQAVIDRALSLLERKLNKSEVLNSEDAISNYLKLKVNHEKEHFYLLSLNSQLRLIACDCISIGTVKDAYVHPREAAEKALERGASAVVFSHNHPSGTLTPSPADHKLTKQLCDMFRIMDITPLDHVIVTYDGSYSFAEMGVMPAS